MSNAEKIFDFYKKLDRSIFIDNEYRQYAGYDSALPIGFEQTISQPSLVCAMTTYLKLSKEMRVLEIGTGSGYQTAFLAEFAREVYTVERIEDLMLKAKERLTKLRYANINFKAGDGSEGWEEYAPYDRIMVTAAAAEIPAPLLAQLAPGGMMVIPVGQNGPQKLLKLKKDMDGKIEEEYLEKVRFVEFKGKYGWNQGFDVDSDGTI